MEIDFEWLIGWVGVVLLVAIVVGGISSCSVQENQEATKQIQIVCSGTMDATRLNLCQRALDLAKEVH